MLGMLLVGWAVYVDGSELYYAEEVEATMSAAGQGIHNVDRYLNNIWTCLSLLISRPFRRHKAIMVYVAGLLMSHVKDCSSCSLLITNKLIGVLYIFKEFWVNLVEISTFHWFDIKSNQIKSTKVRPACVSHNLFFLHPSPTCYHVRFSTAAFVQA